MTVVDSFGDVEKLPFPWLFATMPLCPGNGEVIGEPTESALVRYAFDMGVNKTNWKNQCPVSQKPLLIQ